MSLKKNFSNLFFVISIFLLDRASKLIVIQITNDTGEAKISLTSFLNLNLIWNDGIAFGLFSFSEKIYYNLLTLVIILVIFIVFWMIIRTNGIEKLSFMMIFGGSIGNVFDRIYYSSVPDFIDIHFNNYHWFIFNVADIFISIGVLLLIYLEFFKKDRI
tara:strand:- start:383 stop:859 length:477 start_codon:yes stop_codon:yes gene_type:complete